MKRAVSAWLLVIATLLASSHDAKSLSVSISDFQKSFKELTRSQISFEEAPAIQGVQRWISESELSIIELYGKSYNLTKIVVTSGFPNNAPEKAVHSLAAILSPVAVVSKGEARDKAAGWVVDFIKELPQDRDETVRHYYTEQHKFVLRYWKLLSFMSLSVEMKE